MKDDGSRHDAWLYYNGTVLNIVGGHLVLAQGRSNIGYGEILCYESYTHIEIQDDIPHVISQNNVKLTEFLKNRGPILRRLRGRNIDSVFSNENGEEIKVDEIYVRERKGSKLYVAELVPHFAGQIMISSIELLIQ